MAIWLKRGTNAQAKADTDRQVRDVVKKDCDAALMTGTSLVDGGWTAD